MKGQNLEKLQFICAYLIIFQVLTMSALTESSTSADKSAVLQKRSSDKNGICNERTCDTTCITTSYPCFNFPKCKYGFLIYVDLLESIVKFIYSKRNQIMNFLLIVTCETSFCSECSNNADCRLSPETENHRCLYNVCRRCIADHHCPKGMKCRAGRCIIPRSK